LILNGGQRRNRTADAGLFRAPTNNLESADTIETKALSECSFRIVWDHLGWFPPQVVPVLFPSGKMFSGSFSLLSTALVSGRTLPKSKTRPSGASESVDLR
jgi:hypothetical protein